MTLPLAAWIARRYLGSRSAGRFAPLLFATAVASIAVGTLALIVIMSVMRGFRKELSDRLLGFNAHVTLSRQADAPALSADQVRALLAGFDVRDLAPFVQGEVVAASDASGELNAQGARVRGIDPSQAGVLGAIDLFFPEGSRRFSELEAGKAGLPGAIVGNEIVAQLLVHPDFADRLELTAPLAEIGPSGELMPNRRTYLVSGIFRSGVFDIDSKYILVSLAEARRLLGEQATEGWQVRLDAATEAPAAVRSLEGKMPAGWRAEGVDAQNRKLFAALALERLAMGGILVMVLAIASFAIAGVILLLTAAKRRDVAILQSIGLSPRRTALVFMLNAAFIGAAGAGIGLAAGLGICAALMRWPIPLPSSYYLDMLPVELDPLAAVLFSIVGVAIAVAASIYPVRQVLRLNPVEALRYE